MESLKRRLNSVSNKLTRVFGEFSNLNYRETDVTVFEEYLANVGFEEKDYLGIRDGIFKEIDKFEASKKYTEAEISDQTKEQETRFGEVELQFIKVKSELRSRIKLMKTDEGVPVTNQSQPVFQISHTNLPQVQLPFFSGSYGRWETFKARFNAHVHDKKDIPKIQKFQYLLDCLSDSVKRSIENLDFIEANYQVAYDKLDARFSNKKATVDEHISGIVNIKGMNKESAGELHRILDEVTTHVSALKSLEVPVDSWDVILVYLVAVKLDPESRKRWEETVDKNQLPKWSKMLEVLQKRCNALESVEVAVDYRKKPEGRKDAKPVKSLVVSGQGVSCPKCGSQHLLSACKDFEGLALEQRFDFVRSKGLCFNCLKGSHTSRACSQESMCVTCPKTTRSKHNSLLHAGPKKTTDSPKNAGSAGDSGSHGKTSLNCCFESMGDQQVLLMTAMVLIYGRDDQPHLARALLDSASEGNFMASEFADKLGIKQRTSNQTVVGIQGVESKCMGDLNAFVRSRHKDFGKKIGFWVVEKIAKNIPSKGFSTVSWNAPPHLSLADPGFNKPGPIDVLLGAGIFLELLQNGRMKLKEGLPYLQETVLGWVWSGTLLRTKLEDSDEAIHCNLVSNKLSDLSEQMERFWHIEQPEGSSEKSCEEEICEQHFLDTVSRDAGGRYEVGLPLNDNLKRLGETRSIAVARLNQLTRRLNKNETMKKLYCDFIEEYQGLGHMREVDQTVDPTLGISYLPHHGVYRPDKSTTKLRVVFNASQPSSTGVSLNDTMMNGGVVQRSLHSIMLRHRLHQFAFTADIAKMYRQINVKPEFWSLQRIVWRKSFEDPIKEFALTTVTYGTKNAPYLATRALKQVALDGREKYPLASNTMLNDVYVDDIISGSDDLGEATQKMQQLVSLLGEAGMTLHKWCGNDRRLFEVMPLDQQETFSFDEEKADDVVKTLGLFWKPKEDIYKFSLSKEVSDGAVLSKRLILSEIARLFDPLGLVSPILVRAKIFMQKLWSLKISWDDALPEDAQKEWLKCRQNLKLVSEIEIPRWINPLRAKRFMLYGFADASKDAYGTCIYLKCLDESGSSTSNLIFSKSRVAPLNSTTIPRLELEAALLLCENIKYVQESLDLSVSEVCLFSDSKVVLAWISTNVVKLQVYVANRIRKIQDISKDFKWSYVPTKENPADIVSRGMSADNLKSCSLWWNGPEFLRNSEHDERESDEFADTDQRTLYEKEFKKGFNPPIANFSVAKDDNVPLIDFSRIRTIQNVMVYILRFVNNCRKLKEERQVGRITTLELKGAMEKLVQIIQREAFATEITILKEKGELPANHALRSLNPILINGIVRVGGRISNSKYNLDKKHQMLLPKDHEFTEMLINDLHVRYLHVGPQGLLSILRERFWVVNGRNVIRKILHKCVVCFKVNPRDVETYMGNLPNFRVEPTFPFYKVGVDYGGPLYIKSGGPRSKQLIKSWFAIFICMVTKAIHIELVTSLSSASFRAALQRFICRRGRPFSIYSDNGTNFVGADRELKELRVLFNEQNQGEIAAFCAEDGIEWYKIPPRASHFGGEWEAGVKSIKYHYKRIAGNANLTYEETITLLIQIEGILNSRPLSAMSSDPNDFNPLTPAHFLIGRSITTFPEPDLTGTKDNRVDRFQRITKLRQHFWQRFTQEYVSSLQNRSKWFKKKPDIKVGELVLLKDDNLPSFKWRTGRIIETFPGKDGIVRVVSLRTADGHVFKRDIHKICILPIEVERLGLDRERDLSPSRAYVRS